MTGRFWPWLTGQQPYDPSLIDLQAYEGNLLRAKVRGGTLMPPPTTPGRVDRDWTPAESEAMAVNRERATALYEWVDQLRITDPQAIERKTAPKMRAAAAGRAR